MSADNWAKCPKCTDLARVRVRNAEREANEVYGLVPAEEFQRLLDLARTALNGVEEYGSYRTFREDYDIYGAEEGMVQVRYRGHCSVCGLTARVEQNQEFYTGLGQA